jgi:thymidylate synthase (FAD)
LNFKTIRDARLFLIVRPAFDVDSFVRFLTSAAETWSRTDIATPAENIVEVAGRVCYMSFGDRQSPRTNSQYISRLIEQGHESVLEHVSWSFILTGVTRSFTHQFVRHRVGFAFSQVSQQYRDQSDAAVIEPLRVSEEASLSKAWRAAIEQSAQTYRALLRLMESMPDTIAPSQNRREFDRRIRSAARSVLPEAVETTIVFTANARAIRHFLEIRGGILGDDEMRIVSALILETLLPEAPALFSDFTIEQAGGLPLVKRVQVAHAEVNRKP